MTEKCDLAGSALLNVSWEVYDSCRPEDMNSWGDVKIFETPKRIVQVRSQELPVNREPDSEIKIFAGLLVTITLFVILALYYKRKVSFPLFGTGVLQRSTLIQNFE